MAIAPPSEPSTQSQDEPRASATLYDIGFQKWKQQQADIEVIDRKAFSLFTISSTALIAVLAVIKLREPVNLWAIGLSAIGFLAFVSVIVLILLAVRIRSYDMGPSAEWTRIYADQGPDEMLKHWAGRQYLNSFEANAKALRPKVSFVKWAMRASSAEFLFLALALIASFFPTP